jgi:hypothetical protein
MFKIGNILSVLVGIHDQRGARTRRHYAYVWGYKTSAMRALEYTTRTCGDTRPALCALRYILRVLVGRQDPLCALRNILRVLVGIQDQRCARSGIYYAFLWGDKTSAVRAGEYTTRTCGEIRPALCALRNILRVFVGRQDQRCARSGIYYAYL